MLTQTYFLLTLILCSCSCVPLTLSASNGHDTPSSSVAFGNTPNAAIREFRASFTTTAGLNEFHFKRSDGSGIPLKPDLRKANPKLKKFARDAKEVNPKDKERLSALRDEATNVYKTAIADEIRWLLVQPRLSDQQLAKSLDDFEKSLEWDDSANALGRRPVIAALRSSRLDTPTELRRISKGSWFREEAMRRAQENGLHPIEGVKDAIAGHGLASLHSYQVGLAHPDRIDARGELDASGLADQLRWYAKDVESSLRVVSRGK